MIMVTICAKSVCTVLHSDLFHTLLVCITIPPLLDVVTVKSRRCQQLMGENKGVVTMYMHGTMMCGPDVYDACFIVIV